MGLLLKSDSKQERTQRELLRAHLRTRTERLGDPSCTKFTRYEIAAALWVVGGSVTVAQRLLVRCAGVSVGHGYVEHRVQKDPELKRFASELRIEHAHRPRGRDGLVCPSCGEMLVQPAAEVAAAPAEPDPDGIETQRRRAQSLRDQFFGDKEWS